MHLRGQVLGGYMPIRHPRIRRIAAQSRPYGNNAFKRA
jgi:hypothetical protein